MKNKILEIKVHSDYGVSFIREDGLKRTYPNGGGKRVYNVVDCMKPRPHEYQDASDDDDLWAWQSITFYFS